MRCHSPPVLLSPRVLFPWLAIAALAAAAPHHGLAQSPGSASPHPLAQALDWLTGQKMQRELDLLPQQQEQLAALKGELRSKTKEVYQEIDATGIPKEDRKILREQAKVELGDEVARELERVLLPHQLKRLRQIALQRRLGQHTPSLSAAAALSSADLAQELGITDQQRDELRRKEKEVKAELERKAKELLRELRNEAQDELSEVLTPTQRQQLKEMLGEKFEWE